MLVTPPTRDCAWSSVANTAGALGALCSASMRMVRCAWIVWPPQYSSCALNSDWWRPDAAKLLLFHAYTGEKGGGQQLTIASLTVTAACLQVQ